MPVWAIEVADAVRVVVDAVVPLEVLLVMEVAPPQPATAARVLMLNKRGEDPASKATEDGARSSGPKRAGAAHGEWKRTAATRG